MPKNSALHRKAPITALPPPALSLNCDVIPRRWTRERFGAKFFWLAKNRESAPEQHSETGTPSIDTVAAVVVVVVVGGVSSCAANAFPVRSFLVASRAHRVALALA